MIHPERNPFPTTVAIHIVAAALMILMPGCAHEELTPGAREEIPIPEGYAKEKLPPENLMAKDWSESLGAPELLGYIERAYSANFQLRSAIARVREAEALLQQATTARLPFLGLEGSAAEAKQEIPIPGRRSIVREETYELSAAARWEIDLWNRLGNRKEAAQLEKEAREQDLQTVRVRLNANIAQSWFNYLAAREKLFILTSQAERAEAQLQLLETRFLEGAGTVLDLSRQEQRVESFTAMQIRTHESAAQSQHALAILIGEDPQRFDAYENNLPEPPPIPNPGIPADLLLQRPDLRAAFLRLRAQDARTAAAAAERLPQIQLSVRGFTSAQAIGDLFENFLWSIAGEASQTLFDFGATEARVEAAEARAEIALANFGQAWLDALRDVADAFIRVEAGEALLETTRSQLEAARNNRDLTLERYLQGQVGFLRVLETAQSVDELEQQEVDTRLGRLLARIQLVRALGGTWLKPSTTSAESD